MPYKLPMEWKLKISTVTIAANSKFDLFEWRRWNSRKVWASSLSLSLYPIVPRMCSWKCSTMLSQTQFRISSIWMAGGSCSSLTHSSNNIFPWQTLCVCVFPFMYWRKSFAYLRCIYLRKKFYPEIIRWSFRCFAAKSVRCFVLCLAREEEKKVKIPAKQSNARLKQKQSKSV